MKNFDIPAASIVKRIEELCEKKAEENRASEKKTAKNRKIKRKAKKPKSFECYICHKSLCSRSSLGQHLRDKHNEKLFYCTDCSSNKKSKGIKYIYNLRTHTIEKHGREPTDQEKIPRSSSINKKQREKPFIFFLFHDFVLLYVYIDGDLIFYSVVRMQNMQKRIFAET